MRAHEKLTQQTQAAGQVANANIDWDSHSLLELGSTAQVFVPPFTTFDVQTIDLGGFVVSDESFARPDIGHLINNFAYDQDESTSYFFKEFQFLPYRIKCGVVIDKKLNHFKLIQLG